MLSEHDERWIIQLLRRCVTAGWVDFHGGDRPLVVLTEAGNDVIHERRPARLLLPPRQSTAAGLPVHTRPKKRRVDHSADLEGNDSDLFEELRRYRMEIAREEHVPPYVVASDRTLRDIALLRPSTIDELKLAHGMGPAKAERYGDGLLQVVRQAT